jgi:chemotaxis protein MotB
MRKRHKKEDEHENTERWMISYADFLTLLFALFAALYAMSVVDKMKAEQFAGSLRQVFQVIDDPIVVHEDRARALIEDIKENIKDIPGVSVRGEMRGVVVTFPDAVLFPSGSAEIKQDATGMLNNLARTLNAVPGRIIIEGHTDNVPLSPGARYASNWELSTARAASILHFLVIDGLDPNRFAIAGYAEFRPVASNATEDGRARNRRVELVITL